MKKLKSKIIIVGLLTFALVLSMSTCIFANNAAISTQEPEYTESYKKWLELSEEEKKGLIEPRKYEVPYTKVEPKNPLLKASMLRSGFESQYSLKNVIANNIVIKDQQNTNLCWAFASLSSLETNLALADYNNGITSKIYDFSERHMEYATSRTFENNEINEKGYNRSVGSGGTWGMASSYLTSGMGAIDETDMPFENNENIINISQIQNKDVKTQVHDTIEFPNYHSMLVNEEESEEIINQIKNHIQNHGSVMTGIKAGSSFFAQSSKISNTTGALAVGKGSDADHGVAIIGWDDNYAVSKWNEFDENDRPTSPGAWIARNSWGENAGDNGLIYISYEDQTASQAMSGIVKAANELEYENIYQHTYYYPNNSNEGGYRKNIQCNIFDKKTSSTEYLTQVSLNVASSCKARVLVNPNGTEKTKEDLQVVTLKAGESETLTAGYHTLELAQPIEITSNQFAVAVELEGIDDSSVYVTCAQKDDNLYSGLEIQSGKSFVLAGTGYLYHDDWSGWKDLASEQKISTLKAFTNSGQYDGSLTKIEITTPPTKTSYFEGEDFDKTGMVVKATFNRITDPVVTLDDSNYSITDGNNLEYGQTKVTITYEGKSVEQNITVEKNDITELRISNPPTKTEYKEGQNFDKTGMVVEATYRNGSSKTISDYEITNGNNLKSNQTSVTITYENQTAEQAITVTPNPLMEINITKEPNKTSYVVGQNFDRTGMVVTGTFQDGSTEEILEYTIENGDNLAIGQTSVTIKYGDKTTEQAITVEEKAITSISISKMPTKTIYEQNEENLDLTGGSITVKYNDNSTEEIPLTSELVKVSGFNNKEVGKNTITVEYESKTTTFDVNIVIVAEIGPENSNFDNISCKISSGKYYTYSDPNKKEYFLVGIMLGGISRSTENDSTEYYYYLSPNPNDENITDWVKISEEQNSNSSLSFKINTKDVKNFSEVLDAENTYLYIKEVALLGGSQSIKISKAMKMEPDVELEIYLDDKLVTDSSSKDTGNKESKAGKESKSEGSTTPSKLPNTGVASIFVLIIVFIVAGTVFYVRYKDLSTYIK